MSAEKTNEARRVPGTASQAPVIHAITLSSLTPENALALVKERPESAANALLALLNERTDELPGTSFVRRDDNVFLKKMRQTVRLSKAEGHLNQLGGDKWDITLNGLRRLNNIAALNIVRPSQVMVDGVAQMNPYIQVDAKSKQPEVVYCRAVCIGYSQTGALVATDVMVRLDLNIYLIENIQSKLKKRNQNDQSHPFAKYGKSTSEPKTEGDWTFMPMHSVGDIGMWVDLSHPSISEILNDHTTKLKFIERLAQSFAERNALKAHPIMPKALNVHQGVAFVTVVGWTTDFSRTEIDEFRVRVEKGEFDQIRDRRGNAVAEVERKTVTDLDEGTAGDLEDVAGEEAAHEQQEREKAEIEGKDLLPKAMDLYTKCTETLTKSRAKKMLAEAEIEALEGASKEQLVAFIAIAEKALNEAA